MTDDAYNKALRTILRGQMDQLYTTVEGPQFPLQDSHLKARVCLDALLSAYLTYAASCGMPPDGVAYALRLAAESVESGEARATGQAMLAEENRERQGAAS